MVAKSGFTRCAPQRPWGDLKHGVDMVVTRQWEPSESGGEISELRIRELAKDENKAHRSLAGGIVLGGF